MVAKKIGNEPSAATVSPEKEDNASQAATVKASNRTSVSSSNTHREACVVGRQSARRPCWHGSIICLENVHITYECVL